MAVAPSLSYNSEGAFDKVSLSANTVPRYEMLEMTVLVSAIYRNPYDPGDIEVNADITPAGGRTATVPAFYSGDGNIWKVRYTPVRAGNYSYRLTLKVASGTYTTPTKRFKVIPGPHNGFLRQNPDNPRYLIFDSNTSFFGLGHNICWLTNNTAEAYEKYFTLFKENGCNLSRVWLNTPWTFRIETERLGIYNAEDSEKLDALIALAAQYDIYLIIVLDSYSSLMEENGPWNEQSWGSNPYNIVNGGPCKKPLDFFTDPDAKKHYKNRIRYIMARWGYSPNILAFELWNEFDAPVEWTKEMASYIKAINPHGQLVTTSLGYPWANNFDETTIWDLPEVDLISRHIYGNITPNLTTAIISVNTELSKRYPKPVLVAEFGLDAGKSDAEIDESGLGVGLHNSLWASAMSGSFAGALNWWWAEYVKAKNLYPQYKAIGNFMRDVDWASGRISVLEPLSVMTSLKCTTQSYSNVVVRTVDAWGDTDYKQFTVSNNGDLAGGAVNSYLHGNFKEEYRIEPVFHVNYPKDGKFILRIDTVSQGARLVAYIDNNKVLAQDLPAGEGEGPWKRSLYRQDHKIYQCVYDMDVEIDVPKGRHTIRLANTGTDWIRIRKITLTDYLGHIFANAGACGLKVGDQTLIWIYNKEYTPKNASQNGEISLVKGAYILLPDMADGKYKVELWDTSEGAISSTDTTSVDNGELTVSLPDFSKDIACKIRKE